MRLYGHISAHYNRNNINIKNICTSRYVTDKTINQ